MRLLDLVPPGQQREDTLGNVLHSWADRDLDALRAWTNARSDPREKTLGQLFCDKSSQQVIEMLRVECAKGRVEWWQPCEVRDVRRDEDSFHVETPRARIKAAALVIAGYLWMARPPFERLELAPQPTWASVDDDILEAPPREPRPLAPRAHQRAVRVEDLAVPLGLAHPMQRRASGSSPPSMPISSP